MSLYLAEGRYYKTLEEARKSITSCGGEWELADNKNSPPNVEELWFLPKYKRYKNIWKVDIVEKEGRCSTCKAWENMNECGACAGSDDYRDMPLGDDFFVFVTAADDTGLSGKLRTGPDFGCIKWEKR